MYYLHTKNLSVLGQLTPSIRTGTCIVRREALMSALTGVPALQHEGRRAQVRGRWTAKCSLEQLDGEDGRLGERLLERKGSDGHHRHTPICDLGVAHRRAVGAERIEAEHAWEVVGLLAVLLVQALALPVHGKGNDGAPVHAVHLTKAAVEQRGRAAIA